MSLNTQPDLSDISNEQLERIVRSQKSVGKRILLGVAGIGIGLGVQVVGAIVDKIIGIPLFGILGFAVMGYLVYRWAIR